ncbi:hypothetical protein [Pontimicrobium sp. SW4]|uniref:Ribosome maturation factor RimM n=1 Tax=Pontimicrobium sp. SW4 TaxID=3153519 RepID=A0AAU7BV16_9FLAO
MENNLLKKIFSDSKKQKTFISIYSNEEDTDVFSIGIICNFDDDFVLIKKVSPEGNFDGFSILLIEDIYSIEYGDKYLKKMQLSIKEDIINISDDIQDLLLSNFRFDDLLKLCSKKRFLVSINSVYNRNFIGYIEDFDGENVIINNVDEYNENDGFSFFRILEIERISLFETELKTITNIKKVINQ